jgi:hypothetical protein
VVENNNPHGSDVNPHDPDDRPIEDRVNEIFQRTADQRGARQDQQVSHAKPKPPITIRAWRALFRRRTWRRMAGHPPPNWAEKTTIIVTLGIFLVGCIQAYIYLKQTQLIASSVNQTERSVILGAGQLAVANRNAKTAEDSLNEMQESGNDTHELASAAKTQALRMGDLADLGRGVAQATYGIPDLKFPFIGIKYRDLDKTAWVEMHIRNGEPTTTLNVGNMLDAYASIRVGFTRPVLTDYPRDKKDFPESDKLTPSNLFPCNKVNDATQCDGFVTTQYANLTKIHALHKDRLVFIWGAVRYLDQARVTKFEDFCRAIDWAYVVRLGEVGFQASQDKYSCNQPPPKQ